MVTAWIRRPSGLVDRREVPELTLAAAIDRSWRVPEGGVLLQPEPEKYLPTYPSDRPRDYIPIPIGRAAEYSPGFLCGLPEV